jgi:hypothetical protein
MEETPFMRLVFFVACAMLATSVGCSGGDFAPVSGVVKLDGKPYAKAAVSFQPVGDKDNPYPGRGSSAYTDENGRFVLTSDNTTDGAVVGKHLVRITTRYDAMPGEPGVGTPDGAAVIRRAEPIPLEWNAESKKQFDVPAGGTDQANFDIVTKK